MFERHVRTLCLKGVCFWGLIVAIQAGIAEEVKILDKPLSAEEMGRLLFPDKTRPKTRSLSFSSSKTKQVAEDSIALALPIQFDLNSAELQEEAKPFLDEIGRMLTMDQFRQGRLLIEGHTDATGPESYNEWLSRKRAEAVKNYLISRFAIEPHRLRIVGLGERKPLPGKHPNDPLNRRVELHRIVQ